MSAGRKKYKISTAKQFIRAIHSYSKSGKKQAPSLRHGLSNTRTLTDSSLFPKIIEEIQGIPIYLKLIAPTQFPQTISEMKKGIYTMYMLEDLGELMWTSAVLSIFKEKLCGFMVAKKEFDESFLKSEFEDALGILVKIEENFGQSIWLLKNKICVLQLLYGLKEQKDYLENLLSTEFFTVHGALISYHVSLRSEESVTSAEIDSDLEEFPGEIASYFRYHLTPANLDKIENTAVVQCVEETQTLVDRLMAHIAMLQLYVAKCGLNDRKIGEVLELSSWIPDTAVQNLVKISSDIPVVPEPTELEAYERYALGEYGLYFNHKPEVVELIAYSKAYKNRADNSETLSFFGEAAELMAKMVSYSSDVIKTRSRLGKIAMLSPSLPLSLNISNFLSEAHSSQFDSVTSVKSRLALINASLANPRNWSMYKELNKNFRVSLTDIQRELNCVKLFEYMDINLEDGTSAISSLDIPRYRRDVYIGHLAFRQEKYIEAERNYRVALESAVVFPKDRVKSYLFGSVFSQAKIEEAVKLVVSHCVENKNVAHLYPLAELSSAALKIKTLRSNIHTAILIHLTARNVHSKWERKLSDICENVLFQANVNKPSELAGEHFQYEPRMLIYFLRHVCVSRILDDSSAYNSVEEIEEERIAICQWLTELEPSNKSVYASEIKDITRNENIATIWHQFQSSKVYVDEDGLRNYLAPSFKETFRRYLILRDSPSLNTQAEKLAKALEKMLKDVNSGFKNIKLPASEAESLFNTMIYQFLSSFAAHPAYGLDTHLSTAVRHGVFEGHIRTALINVISPKIESGYTLSPSLRHKMSCHSESVDLVQGAFTRFTRKVESLIEKYLADYFRIDSDITPSGLFSFMLPDNVRSEAMERMNTISDYDDFISEFFSIAWLLTDSSTKVLKQHLADILAKQIYQGFDAILEGLRPALGDNAFAVVEKEVVDARLRFQKTLEDISGWFNRPQTSHPDEIDMDMVVAVALKQIANCYTNDKLIPSVDYLENKKVCGSLLSGLVETLFILLQNIIIHGGVEKDLKGVKLAFGFTNNALSITVENPVGLSVDLENLKVNIAESLERYRTGAGLTKAGTEGGSGLSKIWRIMEFDIKKPNTLKIQEQDRVFTAQIIIENIEFI